MKHFCIYTSYISIYHDLQPLTWLHEDPRIAQEVQESRRLGILPPVDYQLAADSSSDGSVNYLTLQTQERSGSSSGIIGTSTSRYELAIAQSEQVKLEMVEEGHHGEEDDPAAPTQPLSSYSADEFFEMFCTAFESVEYKRTPMCPRCWVPLHNEPGNTCSIAPFSSCDNRAGEYFCMECQLTLCSGCVDQTRFFKTTDKGGTLQGAQRFSTFMRASDWFESTSLHIASTRGMREAVEMLLQAGTNVNACDIKNGTPLHRAAERGHRDIVELLLKHRANVNASDTFGRTPLRRAAENDHRNVVQSLLEGGACWHTFAEQGQLELVTLCLELGANVNALDEFGLTPLRRAVERGHKEVARFLREEYGAVMKPHRSNAAN